MKRKLIITLVAVMAMSTLPTMAFAGTGKVVTNKPKTLLVASKSVLASADAKTQTSEEKEKALKDLQTVREAKEKEIKEKASLTEQQKKAELEKIKVFFDKRVEEINTEVKKVTDKLDTFSSTDSTAKDIIDEIGVKANADGVGATGIYQQLDNIKTKVDDAMKEYNDKGTFPDEVKKD